MIWSSWSDFWHMGGYGLYVWGAYAVRAGDDAGRALAGAPPSSTGSARRRAPRVSASMKPRHKRLAVIGGIVAAVGVAAALVLNAFQSNLVFFYSPSQVAAKEAPQGRTFRIGGLVKEGSVKRDGTEVQFAVTDTAQTIAVHYQGILPDLFKEGKGVVAQGQLRGDGVFVAREVLAKHDENYMPPEAAEALKRAAKTNEKIGQHRGRRRQAMIPELGQIALLLALAVALVQGVCRSSAPRAAARRGWRWRGRRRRRSSCWSRSRSPRWPYAFAHNDFSVLYVAANSNSALPLHYRIAGVWGGHEGSLLLWLLMLNAVDAGGGAVQPPPAAAGGGAHPRRDGPGQHGLPAVHAADLQPVRPPAAGRGRRARPEPAAAGPGHGRSTRRCSTWAMSASRWRSRSRSRR